MIRMILTCNTVEPQCSVSNIPRTLRSEIENFSPVHFDDYLMLIYNFLANLQNLVFALILKCFCSFFKSIFG